MGIFDRLGKVISSNVNAMLDGAEDDKKLLELNIDEMDEQLKRAKKEVIAAVAAEKRLGNKASEQRDEVSKWEQRAELALKSDDEALAREALKQKRRVQSALNATEEAQRKQQAEALEMKEELERMERKVEEIKLRRGSIAARAAQARAGGGTESLGAKGGKSAFSAFKQMEERIEGREAQSAAMDEIDEALGQGPSADELEAKFRKLERDQGGDDASGDIEDELRAMKKRIRV